MPVRKSRRTDVLIVGSGAVGVAAGLEAHEAGAQQGIRRQGRLPVDLPNI